METPIIFWGVIVLDDRLGRAWQRAAAPALSGPRSRHHQCRLRRRHGRRRAGAGRGRRALGADAQPRLRADRRLRHHRRRAGRRPPSPLPIRNNNCVTNGAFVASQISERPDHRHHLRLHGAGADADLLDPRHRQLCPWRVLHDRRDGGLLHHRGLVPRHHPLSAVLGACVVAFVHRRGVRAADADADVSRQDRPAGRIRHPGHLRAGLHAAVFRAGDAWREPGQGAALHRLSAHPLA